MPAIQNVTFDKGDCSFEVHGVDLAIVNALRRILLSDIPVVGFRGEEDPSFEIIKNTGPLHNEFMLHRLGLIPMHLNEEETESFLADEYVVELDVENTAQATINVTTKDFKVTKNGRELTSKEVARLFPPHPVSKGHVLITRARVGEALHVKGKPTLATATVHAGFAAAFCSMSYIEDPVGAAQATNVLDKERAYLRNEFGDPTAFRFSIEPLSGLGCRYLVTKAFEVMRAKLQKVITELYQEPSTFVTMTPWDGEKGSGYEFTFQGENDTLGNLLQSLMFNHYIRGKKATEHGRTVCYVGYVCPHPLESTVVLRIVFADNRAPLSEYIECLAESCRRITADLQSLEAEWLRANVENN